jgi:O-methyltransferase domain
LARQQSDTFWQAAASLGECVRTGKNAFQLLHGNEAVFDYLETHQDLARVLDNAMSGGSTLTGIAAARAYDFASIKHIVDVAGGHGKMLASILKAHPHLCGTLYDLPRVVDGTSAFLAQEGIADRCEVVGGDMFTSVPTAVRFSRSSLAEIAWVRPDLRADRRPRSEQVSSTMNSK